MNRNKIGSMYKTSDHIVRCASEDCGRLGLRRDACPMCGEYRCPAHASGPIVFGDEHGEAMIFIDPNQPEGRQRFCVHCSQGPQRLSTATAQEVEQEVKDSAQAISDALCLSDERKQVAMVLIRRFEHLIEELDSMKSSPLERIVWAQLIARDLDRYLEPQVELYDPSGQYIVRADFASTLLKLAVFTDGHTYHDSPDDQRRDASHNQRLAAMGWVVKRYWTEEVKQNHQRLCDEIYGLVCDRLLHLQQGKL